MLALGLLSREAKEPKEPQGRRPGCACSAASYTKLAPQLPGRKARVQHRDQGLGDVEAAD